MRFLCGITATLLALGGVASALPLVARQEQSTVVALRLLLCQRHELTQSQSSSALKLDGTTITLPEKPSEQPKEAFLPVFKLGDADCGPRFSSGHQTQPWPSNEEDKRFSIHCKLPIGDD